MFRILICILFLCQMFLFQKLLLADDDMKEQADLIKKARPEISKLIDNNKQLSGDNKGKVKDGVNNFLNDYENGKKKLPLLDKIKKKMKT